MTPIPFFGYGLYEMYLLFLFWSFIGWGIEVCYMTIETGEYQNRGFLNMPICPIYGLGVLLIAAVFRPVNHTFLPLFAGSALLCTAFELSVGLLMEKVFHGRWWDYSHEHFNFKGLICLKVSILWGLGCVLVIRIVHPIVEKIVMLMPIKVGAAVIIVSSVLIAIDLTATLISVNQLSLRLEQLENISEKMLAVSVTIGGVLADRTNDVVYGCGKVKEGCGKTREKLAEKINEGREALGEYNEQLREEYSELKVKYEQLLESNPFTDRLVKAFPTMSSIRHSRAMNALKQRLNPKTEKQYRLKREEVLKKKEHH